MWLLIAPQRRAAHAYAFGAVPRASAAGLARVPGLGAAAAVACGPASLSVLEQVSGAVHLRGNAFGSLGATPERLLLEQEPARSVHLGAATVAVVGARGTLFVGGAAQEGQLGRGGLLGPSGSYHGGSQLPFVAPLEPLALPEGERAASAALSRTFSLFLAESGRVFSCGSSFDGALGLGDEPVAMTPVPVAGLPSHDPVVRVACALTFSVAICRSGRVFVWGRLGRGGTATALALPKARPASREAATTSAATEGVLTSSTPLELSPEGFDYALDGPDSGLRMNVACGLHHALLSFSGSLSKDGRAGSPRAWSLGVARGNGALGLGAEAGSRLRPAEIDLRSLASQWGCEGDPSLARSIRIAAGPFCSAIALDGHLFVSGRISDAGMLGGLGRAAFEAASKTRDEILLARDLGHFGEGEDADDGGYVAQIALDATPAGSDIVIHRFVPVLDAELGRHAGGRVIGGIALGLAHGAILL
jgi:hypothetical protein